MVDEPQPAPVPSGFGDSRRAARELYRRIRLRLTQQVLLAVGSFAVSAALALFATDPGFDDSQRHTVFLLAFAVLLWLTEAVPPFAVGLFIICYSLFAFGTPVLNRNPEDAQKYLDSWSSSVIFLMLGGFFLADAMRKVGLDREAFRLASKVFGRDPGYVLLGLMLTTTLLSMVMSNTATTAMMVAAATPVLRGYGPRSGYAKAVLVGIPAAASVGGMGTIIGSPPNAIAVGALERAGVTVTFLDWMLLGAPIALVLSVSTWLALGWKYEWGDGPVEMALDPEPGEEEGGRSRRVIVLGTMAVTIGLWLTSSLHPIPVATVSAVPVALLTVTGVLEAKDMRALPWDTLMLVAGGLSLGLAIVDHGVAEFYLGRLDVTGVAMATLMIVFGYITVVLSNVMSNTATATILIPVASVLLAGRADAVTLMVALSASAALLLPVSTPPNAIAFSTGMVEVRDFRFGGVLVGTLAPVLIVAWVWVLRIVAG